MTPTQLHQRLDEDGHLDAAHGPGVYALQLAIPDSAEAVHRAWLERYEPIPSEAALDRLAAAECVAYVGASTRVYDRLMDHAERRVRQAAYLRVFDVADVVGVWPDADPFEAERSRAYELAEDGWRVIVDGEVVG